MKKSQLDKKIVIFIGLAIATFIGINVCLWATSNASQNSESDNGHAEAGGMEFGGQSIGGGGREWSEERGNFRNVVLGGDDNCDYDPEKDKWIDSAIAKNEVGLQNGYIDGVQNDKRPESHDYYYMSRLSFKDLHFGFSHRTSTRGGEVHENSIGVTYDKESAELSGQNSFKFFFKIICKNEDGSGESVFYAGDEFDDKYDESDNGECLDGVLHREEEGAPDNLNTPIEKIRHVTGQDDILEAIHNGSVTFVLYKIQAHH